MKIDSLVRDNIKALRPYSSARHEFEGVADVFLDANESPFATTVNRYPDPLQKTLKEQIAHLKGLASNQIFLGNGSDEGIDLLMRIFCNPGRDKIIIVPPTYGMYQVSADISDIEIVSIPLLDNFQPDVPRILAATNDEVKILFLCSPNNPTGTQIDPALIAHLVSEFKGLVVLDEAYIDFASQPSWVHQLDRFSNLAILQTFSKAWGMAGIRLGMVLAHPRIINYLNSVKPPYNINVLTQKMASEALDKAAEVREKIKLICAERSLMRQRLQEFPLVHKIYDSEANFLLVRFQDAPRVFGALKEKGVVVRDRSGVEKCEGCLRITIGLPEENTRVIDVLKELA